MSVESHASANRAVADILEEILLSNPHLQENKKQEVANHERFTTEAAAEKGQTERLAYTLKEVQELVGISRSAIYLALGAGELRAVKRGRTTLVLANDLQACLEKLPAKS